MGRKIAVLTSGGDAAGMNAAIRAVTRVATAEGAEVVGVKNGYQGLLDADFMPLRARDVGGILQLGGTFLGSARSKEFATESGQERAMANLWAADIDGLVVIGGNGSQTGAYSLSQRGLAVNGVASTIDNDLVGTDITLGVDTALNIVLEAIDRIRSTASSHGRGFLIEVMGRDCGYLALMAGLAGGAEAIVIPEVPTTPAQVKDVVREAYTRGKKHAIVVVAEGSSCSAECMMRWFNEEEDPGFGMRTTILGHVQRGGAPTVQDRILGAQFGAEAVSRLLRGEHGVLVGRQRAELVATPLAEVAGKTRPIDTSLLELAKTLAR